MEDTIAMQIVGSVLFLLASAKLGNPVKFNENIFGEVPEAEVNKLASMRMVLGGVVMAVALALITDEHLVTITCEWCH